MNDEHMCRKLYHRLHAILKSWELTICQNIVTIWNDERVFTFMDDKVKDESTNESN